MSEKGNGANHKRDLGKKPELKWLALKNLYVDQDYQRGTQSRASQNNLEYIQKHFSWSYFAPLIVCFVPEKKKYAVIDGQHRLMAASMIDGIDELPCMIIAGGHELKQQAESFVVINTKRVMMNSLAKFHAAASAGDTQANDVKQLLKECNIEIPRNPVLANQTGPRQTQALGTIKRMLCKYSKNQIKWALTIIPEAYGDEKGQMRGMLINALAHFKSVTPDVDQERMLKVLRDLDPEQLQEDARSSVRIGGGKTATAVFEAIERLYKNEGRKRGSGLKEEK